MAKKTIPGNDPDAAIQAAVKLIGAVLTPDGRTVVYGEMPEIRMAYTVPGWADAYALSVHVAKYALKTGQGPRVLKLGSGKRPRLVILAEDAQRWARDNARPYVPTRPGRPRKAEAG